MKSCRWGDVCRLHYGKALRDYTEQPSDDRRVRVYGTNGPIGWATQALFPQAGVVVGRKGAYRGVHFSAEPCVVIDTAYFLELTAAEIDLKWAYYKLLTFDLNRMDVGAAIPTTNRDQFYALPLCYPPTAVQKNVAGYLSAYDDLIENNRRRMALLEEAARQLYREWFVRLRFPGHEHTRIIDGVPEGWQRTTSYAAMNVLSGGTPKTTVSDYWGGDIPFYTPKDAPGTSYVLKTERSITELGLKNCNSRLYASDTVFISARGTVGKLNLALRPMAMSQSCYALLGKGHVSQLFLFCALREAIEHFKQNAVGAVFNAIVVDTFKLIPFVVPDEKTVRIFEEIVAPMFRQVANLMEQNEKLRAARDLLLPRLMSGEIAV